MRLFLLLTLFLNLSVCAFSQTDVTVYTNATIHTGKGDVISNGYFVTSAGKIVDVGSTLNGLYKNAKVVDVSGKHIYPGIIAMNNFAGLSEIEAVRATHDFNETGAFNPNARAVIAFNTDSKILPTFTFNGILLTQTVPQGGVISGSSSLMKTEGWNWEDAAVLADEGIHLNWPEINSARSHNRQNFVEKRLTEIEDFFANCNSYLLQKKPTETNLYFEAMRNVFNGSKNLYIHASGAKAIVTSVNYFKQKYPNFKLVLVGAEDAYQLTDFLKQNKIAVVLTNIHSLPKHNFSDVDQPYKTASQLYNAGVLVAIGHNESWQARNVMFNAGTAAAYGLTKEQALQCITYNAAKIMGADNLVGSLSVGLNATFVITAGDILDMKTSKIEQAILAGKALDLNNHQVKLSEKYLKKYNRN